MTLKKESQLTTSEGHVWNFVSVSDPSKLSWCFGVECSRCRIRSNEIVSLLGRELGSEGAGKVHDMLVQELQLKYGDDCDQARNAMVIEGVHDS